jgi:tetratricopeptide (TPR) repeat protein
MESILNKAYTYHIVATSIAKLDLFSPQAEDFFTKSLMTLKDLNDDDVIGNFLKLRAHQHISYVSFRARDFCKSLRHCLAELKLRLKLVERRNGTSLKEDLADAYKRIAFNYFELHEFETSLPYAQKSLILRRELNVKDSLLADSCQNVAFALFNMSEFRQALALSLESLDIRKLLSLKNGFAELANSYQTVAFTHYKLGEFFKALTFHKRAMRTRLRMGLLTDELAEAFENVSDACVEVGQYRNAYAHRLNALNARMRLIETTGEQLAECVHGLVFICLKRRDYGAALAYCQRELSLRKRIDSSDNVVKMVFLYKNTAFAYFHLNQIRKALQFRLKALKLENKLFDDLNSNNRREDDYAKLAMSYEHVADLYVELDSLKMATKYFLKGNLGI